MEITDLNNCSRSFNFNVGNLDAPVADMLIIPETDCRFSDVLFHDISLNNPIIWQWTIEGIGTSDKQSDRFFFSDIGEYTVHLWVENAFNCADDTTQVFSIVNQDLRIFSPNTFTPNDDGINDYFKPVISGYVNYTLTVYNRWGEVVYRGNEISQGWAGDMNGNGVICQNDLYYYTILAKGVCDEKLLKGYVQLCE
jgi:gliding motility-associated-like protein